VVLLATDAGPDRSGPPRGKGERASAPADPRAPSQSIWRMAAAVSELQAAQSGTDALSPRSAGDVWIEVEHLKREGHRTRAIEWYASELEGSLRRGADDATARRHILNNLSHEVEVMRRHAQ
jgi:hypothetical protein